MADRRMIHRKVIESDTFYALPEAAQAVYVHLCINADDDGFVNCAGSIATRIKAGKAALQKLVEKRFVLRFGEVYVIKHWRMGNSLRNDRAKALAYPGLAGRIWLKSNRAYTDHPVEGCQTLLELKCGIQNGIPNGIQNGIHFGSLTEQKGTEQKGTEQNRTADTAFSALWTEYPEQRRGAREQAESIYSVVITTDQDRQTAMENLALWKGSEEWRKEGGRYVPYLANWLERGAWMTKPASRSSSPWGASGELGTAELEAIRRIMAQYDAEDRT